MDNDNDISIMRAEARGVVPNYEDELEAAHWLNCELAKLLKVEPREKKHFNPCEFLVDEGEFELCPPINAYATSVDLLEVVDEVLSDLQPWVTALLEVRHQLRRAK